MPLETVYCSQSALRYPFQWMREYISQIANCRFIRKHHSPDHLVCTALLCEISEQTWKRVVISVELPFCFQSRQISQHVCSLQCRKIFIVRKSERHNSLSYIFIGSFDAAVVPITIPRSG